MGVACQNWAILGKELATHHCSPSISANRWSIVFGVMSDRVQVGNVFKYVLFGLREAVKACWYRAALVKLRLGHRSCTIMSRHIAHACLGENVVILQRARLNNVSLGRFSYVGCDSSLSNVDVGSFCSIGPHVKIGLGRHPSRTFVSTYPGFFSDQNTGCPISFRKDKVFDDSARKTIIGNDVWIGTDVIIPGGVRIGTGAIVAAGSVVVKDVPPYAVAGGNPAKIIRSRFTDVQVEALLTSEWWNWPIDQISKNAEWFLDIETFTAMVDQVSSEKRPRCRS